MVQKVETLSNYFMATETYVTQRQKMLIKILEAKNDD